MTIRHKMKQGSVLTLTVGLALALCAPMPAFASGGGSSSSGSSSSASPSRAAPSRSPSYTESYVAIETMQISIIQTAQVRGMLVVSIGLDIPDQHLRERTEHLMPRLRDAYINRLSRHGATRVDPRRVPNVAHLSRLLQNTTDEILGEEGAKVLLMNVLVRSGVNRGGALSGN